MHQQYSRQFELKALHDLFTPVFLSGESSLVHLHPNCDNWETSCAIDMVNHFPYYRVDIKQWEDVSHKDICHQCLKSAWVQIFSYWNADEAKALDLIKHLRVLEIQLELASNFPTFIDADRLIALSFNKGTLAQWLPLMLEGEQIDALFGSRWYVTPNSTAHSSAGVLNFQSLDAPYTYTEAVDELNRRKYGEDTHVV